MPEIPTTLELAARAVLSHPWGSGPWSAHTEHRYDAECAVCQGDVRRVLAVGLAATADHAHQLASSHGGEHDALRQRYAEARIRGLHRNEYGCCVECMKPSAASVPWPCDTIRALDNLDGVSEQAETAETVDQRARDVAFNAIQPALAQTGDWLRLTARRNVADAVLAALTTHGRLVFTAEAEQTGVGDG